MIATTVLLLTRNEERNIVRTIAALPDVSEIVIVDSASTDATVALAIATNPRVRVVTREFDSFARQCNFGLSQIKTEWVLSLDADYVLSAELNAEIAALNSSAETAGYSVDFVYSIFGRPLRGSAYPSRTVLYRRQRAHYVDEGHGHRVVIQGNVQKLSGKIYHDDRKPLSHWIQSQDRYAILEARHLLATPMGQLNFQDRLRRAIFFAAPTMFLYLMFVRGLVLDGWPGWLYVAQRTIAEFILSVRLLIDTKKLEDGR